MKRFSTIIDGVQEQFGIWFSRTLIIFILVFIFFIAGGGVSHNQKWRIGYVDILGNMTVSADVTRSLVRQKLEGNYFFVYARDNSRLFPKSEIESMLFETFPRITSVSASRIDNHKIAIAMTERKPYALWCGMELPAKDCWFIDDAGFVFDKAPVFSKGVYVEVYGKLVEKNIGEPLRGALPYNRFATANTFAKLLHESVGKPFRIALKGEGEVEITIYTSAKYTFLSDTTIRFKDESSPAVLINNLQKAISAEFPDNVANKKKLLYIDMRFGNKVIFGFEN